MLTATRPSVRSVCTACCRSKLRTATAAFDAGSRTWSASSRTSLHKRVRLSGPPVSSSLSHPRHFSASSRSRNNGQQQPPPPEESSTDDTNTDADATAETTERRQAGEAAEGRKGESVGEDGAADEEPAPPKTYAQLEATVRQARQAYGDVLPEALLSGEEFVVYERLYGAPLRIVPFEVLKAEAEAELYEEQDEGERMPDTLWVEGKDGKLRAVEYYHGAPDRGRAVKHEEVLEDEDDEEALAARMEALRVVEGVVEEEEGEWDSEGGGMTANEIRTHPLTLEGRFGPPSSTLQLPKKEFVEPLAEMLAGTNSKHLAEVSQRIFGGERLPHSSSTPRPMGGESVQKPIPLEPSQSSMSSMEGDSYMAAVMPGTYAAVTSILVEVRKRLGTEWIEGLLKKEGGPIILDASSGGAAVVAWREILNAEWERMEEASGSGKHTLAPVGKASVITGSDTIRRRAAHFLENTTFLPRLPDTVLPGEKIGPQARKVYDIIVAPHALWSLKEDYMRKATVQKLWSLLSPRGGVLVLMEKGLPRGFEVVAGARAQLLDNYIASPDDTHLENESLDPANQGRVSRKEEGMIVAPCTNHAGCPMYTMPGISRNRKDFCYFKQRFIRPPFLQKLLGARDRNHEDVQFSYLAVRKGGDLRRGGEESVLQGEEAMLRAFEGFGDKHRNPLEELDEDVVDEDPDSVVAELQTGAPADAAVDDMLEVPPAAAQEAQIAHSTAVVAEEGKEAEEQEDHSEEAGGALMLSLPRMILPPLKRRGHVLLDVCTPAGRLERWTVPRSFGRQAYRDARKAQWGDLWALGAATRVPRNVRLGRKDDQAGAKGATVTGKILASVITDEEKTKLSKRDKARLKKERGKNWKKGKETRRMERDRKVEESKARAEVEGDDGDEDDGVVG